MSSRGTLMVQMVLRKQPENNCNNNNNGMAHVHFCQNYVNYSFCFYDIIILVDSSSNVCQGGSSNNSFGTDSDDEPLSKLLDNINQTAENQGTYLFCYFTINIILICFTLQIWKNCVSSHLKALPLKGLLKIIHHLSL